MAACSKYSSVPLGDDELVDDHQASSWRHHRQESLVDEQRTNESLVDEPRRRAWQPSAGPDAAPYRRPR